MVLPELRIGEHGVHDCVMTEKKQQAYQREACSNEMKYREEVQVVRINLALVSRYCW